MADINSKNMYAALGNDPEYDEDRAPEPPTKTVDPPVARRGKRDAPKTAPGEGAAPSGPRRDANQRTGGFSKEDQQFRSRTNNRHPNAASYVESNDNRNKPTDNGDGTVRGRDSGPGTQRGGRGQRGPRRGGDRHVNRTGRGDHAKQVAHGWGEQTGEGEQEDEKQGEALAQEDKKDEIKEDAAVPDEPQPEAEPEPEDTSVSYADYLAQQAQKKLEGLGLKEARAPNEGAKDNKKWKNATALEKEKAEEAYFEGQAKAKRERERANKKQVIDIDYAFKEPPREGGRGGRGDGRGRGGRGRGEGGRGGRGRGDGDFRPRGGDRGSFRGGRGRANNDQSAPPSGIDQSAFPALGGN